MILIVNVFNVTARSFKADETLHVSLTNPNFYSKYKTSALTTEKAFQTKFPEKNLLDVLKFRTKH